MLFDDNKHKKKMKLEKLDYYIRQMVFPLEANLVVMKVMVVGKVIHIILEYHHHQMIQMVVNVIDIMEMNLTMKHHIDWDLNVLVQHIHQIKVNQIVQVSYKFFVFVIILISTVWITKFKEKYDLIKVEVVSIHKFNFKNNVFIVYGTHDYFESID